jgi:rhamnosyltransferase
LLINENPWVRNPRDRVCAVMVTFHPDEGCAARLRRVIDQVGAALVVDNGSSDEELRPLRDFCGSPPVTLIRNAQNLGIATALNIGARHAMQAGFGWALLLDQDTEADPDMVERLLSALASCGDDRVAAVGSRFRDPRGQSIESLRRGDRGDEWQEVESVITSGCLLSLTAYAAVGPFREDFFIDYVDTEYSFRARAAGYRVLETVRPLMSHSLGAPTAHKHLWVTTWTSNHSPDRRYYMARNNTVLLREYGTSGRGPWQWKSIVRCLRLCKRIAYYERDKFRKIAAVAQGWRDAVRGRMGPR